MRTLWGRLEGGKSPMGARRATVAVLAVLAAGGPAALAQSEGADGAVKAADPARLRAEGLADAATRRFSEVMKEERVAQSKPAAPSLEHATEKRPWSPV